MTRRAVDSFPVAGTPRRPLAFCRWRQWPATPGIIRSPSRRFRTWPRGTAALVQSFRIEGIVCAVIPAKKWITLKDDSAAVTLEAPALDETIRAGDRLAVLGRNCAITQSRFAIQLGTAPTIDLDGIHGATTRSGSVHLEAGLQPIYLSWFNRKGESALKLEYEGSWAFPAKRSPTPPCAGNLEISEALRTALISPLLWARAGHRSRTLNMASRR